MGLCSTRTPTGPADLPVPVTLDQPHHAPLRGSADKAVRQASMALEHIHLSLGRLKIRDEIFLCIKLGASHRGRCRLQLPRFSFAILPQSLQDNFFVVAHVVTSLTPSLTASPS